jgi:hypothetical protein
MFGGRNHGARICRWVVSPANKKDGIPDFAAGLFLVDGKSIEAVFTYRANESNESFA